MTKQQQLDALTAGAEALKNSADDADKKGWPKKAKRDRDNADTLEDIAELVTADVYTVAD